jgi:hypothetical protein
MLPLAVSLLNTQFKYNPVNERTSFVLRKLPPVAASILYHLAAN